MSMMDRLFGRLPDGWDYHACENPDQLRAQGNARLGDEDHGYGEAVTWVARSPQKTWWAWAGTEYASPIVYCPFCGKHLYEEEA